ncbi:hypothetical protein [Nostoc sp.]
MFAPTMICISRLLQSAVNQATTQSSKGHEATGYIEGNQPK